MKILRCRLALVFVSGESLAFPFSVIGNHLLLIALCVEGADLAEGLWINRASDRRCSPSHFSIDLWSSMFINLRCRMWQISVWMRNVFTDSLGCGLCEVFGHLKEEKEFALLLLIN